MNFQTYNNNIIPSLIVHKKQSGQRLDKVLVELLPNYSRSQIKFWILNKQVIVNNQVSTLPRKKMIGGEWIEIQYIEKCGLNHNNSIDPQNIFLNIIYEDHDILVINKPSNIVVHPGFGIYHNTILNALLYRYPDSMTISKRAGIVHRLDKDTTGLMIIAKTRIAYHNLSQLFKERQVIKTYDAIVFGKFSHVSGTINQPIRRHTIQRTCMTVHILGKSAITHYSVIETFNQYSRVCIHTDTGRTHQIRVHMSYIGHPVIGDQKYGKSLTNKIDSTCNTLNSYLRDFKRQALHACTLQLRHPITQVIMKWNAPLPDDITSLLNLLRCK